MANPLGEITHMSTLARNTGGEAGQPLLPVDDNRGARPTADSSVSLRPALRSLCAQERAPFFGAIHTQVLRVQASCFSDSQTAQETYLWGEEEGGGRMETLEGSGIFFTIPVTFL